MNRDKKTGDLKWVDGVEYEWRGKSMGWCATGKGARDRKESISHLLEERARTHGDFPANARISQELKAYFTRQGGWEGLTFVQREALHLIALKISRILSGKGSEADHWNDIAGYAKLCTVFARVEEPCSPPVLAQGESELPVQAGPVVLKPLTELGQAWECG